MDLQVSLDHSMLCKSLSFCKWKSGKKFCTEFLWMLLRRCSINPFLLIKEKWDRWLQENFWTPKICHVMVSNATLYHNYTFNVYWTPAIEIFQVIFNVNSFILFIPTIRANENIYSLVFFWTRRQHLYQPEHNILCFSFQTQNR